jgi:rhodanese-related sulfurtransferase
MKTAWQPGSDDSASTIRITRKGGFLMVEAPRITVAELKRRMEAGEDFTLIDVRKPEAWAESDTQIPEAIRVASDKLESSLSRIPKSRPVVAYCT